MRKTVLTICLIAGCLSYGDVPPVEANSVRVAQATRLQFQGWDFHASNMSYLVTQGKTEVKVTLHIHNLGTHNAVLTESEIYNISQIALTDAQGNTYLSSKFEPNKSLRQSFRPGETLTIRLSFIVPSVLTSPYLEIRSQGEPIRLPL